MVRCLSSQLSFHRCLFGLARIGLSTFCVFLTLSSPLMAEKSPWYISAGFTQMILDSSSDEVVLSDLGDASKLALEAGPIAGSGVTVVGDGQPSLILGYRFKSRPHLSIETVIAPPFVLDLEFTGTIRDESIAPMALGTLETGIPAFGSEFASIKALPAVLTVVYSFNPGGRFQPYIGAGLTAIYTFDHEIKNKELLREGAPKMSVDLAIGPIFQLGIIGRISDKLSVGAEVKRGSGIGIEGRMRNITLLSQNFSDVVGPATVGKGELSLDVDATVLNLSVRWDL